MTTTQGRLTFEDLDVDAVQVRFTNAGDGLTEALKISPKAFHLGDEFACVLRGTVTQINHKEAADGESVIRLHTVKTEQITEVDIEMAQRILTANADSIAQMKAELEGQLELQADEDLEGAEAIASMHEGALSPEFKGQ